MLVSAGDPNNQIVVIAFSQSVDEAFPVGIGVSISIPTTSVEMAEHNGLYRTGTSTPSPAQRYRCEQENPIQPRNETFQQW